MSRILFFLFSFLLLSPTNTFQTPLEKEAGKPKVQIALLLDTSNSMDGLIEQAKSQLWKMVNELALTQKDGQSPEIEIALYEYGNDGLNQESGYIRRVTELTNDLDLVSEKLFALTTNGGNEYCGWVIGNATDQLKWSDDKGDLKLIIIAGNEPFDQGPKDFHKSCKEAISRGIQINTIFCGNYNEGVRTHWKKGADLADGLYFNIDPNAEVVYIPTPYDDEILRLNEELNKTYIYYGYEGEAMKERQEVQDANAASMGSANMASRASFKAKKQYNNADWDLVDALEKDAVVVDELTEEQLPEEMQGMSPEERRAYVEEMAEKRKKIRAQILELDQKARNYRAEKEKEMTGEGGNTLDEVMLKALREQARGKGFNVAG